MMSQALFAQNVMLPYIKAWQGFEPLSNQQVELQSLSNGSYADLTRPGLPEAIQEVLHPYQTHFAELAAILSEGERQRVSSKDQRTWLLTAHQQVKMLRIRQWRISVYASDLSDRKLIEGFVESIRLLVSSVEEVSTQVDQWREDLTEVS